MTCEQTKDLTFGQAIELIKLGKKLCRTNWTLKETYICFVQDHRVINGTIGLKRCSWEIELGWRPSSGDMLSNDWYVI